MEQCNEQGGVLLIVRVMEGKSGGLVFIKI